ncbi:Gfo/Idh/MocA family protein [Oricola sp.]|uniref:Gfo/Idh/MocA family protein n=1 Tax=Oricola sp. TaxID=1979950 RepID=UPI003BAD2185
MNADTPSSLKIAVIGCGYWGANHVRTLGELGVLAAVADLDLARAAELAAPFGAKACAPDDVFADPAIDAVVLALPAQLHAQFALRALADEKHVFVEKPLALSSADAAHVADMAATAGRVLMTGHILRFHNAFVALQEIVASGALGEIKYVQSHRLGFGKFHAQFDALWDLAPHDISLILTLTGSEPERVTGIRRDVSVGSTDFAHVHMDFANGMGAHVHVSRHSPYRERRFAVIGSDGMAVWDDFLDWPQKLAICRQRIDRNDTGFEFALSEADYVPLEANMALTDELRHFISCIESGDVPHTDGRQGVAVLRVLEAAGR